MPVADRAVKAIVPASGQSALTGFCPLAAAIEELAHAGGVEERGAVFTRREVVDFILDLSGYTTNESLIGKKLLEPSFGDGDFLLPAIERVLAVWVAADSSGAPEKVLQDCIRAVELHRESYERTRAAALSLLTRRGISTKAATKLVDIWLIHGDFLLTPLRHDFDVVIGNPPYVRQELIPDVLLAEYRARYKTVYDRADLYIPFIERSLTSLSTGGTLGFICADRWMKNRYGGPLRELVAKEFHLVSYVDMVDTEAFHSDVIAYPAITIIRRAQPGPTRIARRPAIDKVELAKLTLTLTARNIPVGQVSVREISDVATGRSPWLLDASERMSLVRRLEREFPTLEEAGCKVGIGVATGADRAFIGNYEDLDVEPDRKLPLAMTRDIKTGTVEWRGFGVINPFDDDGGLVSLKKYPRLRRYLEARQEEISGRHVAQKAPANWYRTIDRITPILAREPKLLIPDIKGEAQVVYEAGELYPHHNLYFITSKDWDLHALQAVLLSGIARLFVSVYSTRMRGGYLRFQAQYLRRIRVPRWRDVPVSVRAELKRAAEAKDTSACNRAVFKLYGLAQGEVAALTAEADQHGA